VWHQFDASWDVIDNRKMSKKEKEEMKLERETFLVTSSVGWDDIDTYLLGENWEPMPAYDSDGHFHVDEDYSPDAAGDAEFGVVKADDDSYN